MENVDMLFVLLLILTYIVSSLFQTIFEFTKIADLADVVSRISAVMVLPVLSVVVVMVMGSLMVIISTLDCGSGGCTHSDFHSFQIYTFSRFLR